MFGCPAVHRTIIVDKPVHTPIKEWLAFKSILRAYATMANFGYFHSKSFQAQVPIIIGF